MTVVAERRPTRKSSKPERQRRPSFANELDRLPLDRLVQLSLSCDQARVERALSAERPGLAEVAALISQAASPKLAEMAQKARALTKQRFGRTLQIYAPLYLSNHCVNTCLYCGFSRPNQIARKTLTAGEVAEEARILRKSGIRHMLLVAAEHPKLIPPQYVIDSIKQVAEVADFVQVEVQAYSEMTYRELRQAGCDGVVLYQETYDRDAYSKLHPFGLKSNIDNRLDAPDRIGLAGMRHAGLGVLLGINERWRRDVLALMAHASYIQRRYWRMQVSVSLPRLKAAAGGFEGPVAISDQEFLQAICALRLALPQVPIVLSTREPAQLRDALAGIGVTHMSAGSSTEPGGYGHKGSSQEQFTIEDGRSPQQMAQAIAALGFEPVWKDWEHGL